jgi:hypothetical protein
MDANAVKAAAEIIADTVLGVSNSNGAH